MPSYHEYLSNGVCVDSVGPAALKIYKVGYDGLLAQSGATEVFAHVGFDSDWEHARDYPMVRTAHGFETSVILREGQKTFHVCFRDPAGNWDNNSGANYSFRLKDKTDSPDERYGIWNEEHLAGSYYWQE
jgi:hypothetical protein